MDSPNCHGCNHLGPDSRLALGSGPASLERLSHFSEASFQPAGFRPIPVPSNWSLQGFKAIAYSRMRQAGEGFYLYNFRAPESLKGKRTLLHFDGVWSSAEVCLNSQPLGRNDSGFTGIRTAFPKP
jgi:beta-galactosidase